MEKLIYIEKRKNKTYICKIILSGHSICSKDMVLFIYTNSDETIIVYLFIPIKTNAMYQKLHISQLVQGKNVGLDS